MVLENYAALIEEINLKGILFLSPHPKALPSVSDLTHDEQWHTGKADDPWIWKDRAAAERVCVYTRLGARPAFVSLSLLPALLAAKGDVRSVEEIYHAGEMERMAYRLWGELKSGFPRAVHELKGALGIGKQEQSAFNRALVLLQERMLVAVAGSVRKRSLEGAEYGWHVCVYQSLGALFPDVHLQEDPAAAKQALMDCVFAQNPGLTVKEAERVLGLHRF